MLREDAGHRGVAGKSRGIRVPGCFHSGDLRDAFEKLTLEMIGGGIAGVASLVQIELREQNILRIEAEIHRESFAEATQRNKSCSDGDAAEGDLRGEQHVAKGPAAAGGGPSAAALDDVIRIGLEYLAQRHDSKQNAGDDGHNEVCIDLLDKRWTACFQRID